MKYTILFLLLPFFGLSQIPGNRADTLPALTNDTVVVTLTEYQHTLLIAYLNDKGAVERNKYIRYMGDKIAITKDTAGKYILARPSRRDAYPFQVYLLLQLAYMTGSQQSRLVCDDWQTIKTSLHDQLIDRRPDVYARLDSLYKANQQQHAQVIQNDGINYLAAFPHPETAYDPSEGQEKPAPPKHNMMPAEKPKKPTAKPGKH